MGRRVRDRPFVGVRAVGDHAVYSATRDENSYPKSATPVLTVPSQHEHLSGSRDAAAPTDKHFRALFESIDDGVSILEILFDESDHAIDYRFLAVNRAHHAVSGVGTEVVGKRMSEVKPAIDPSMMQRLGNVALTGEAVRFEDYIRAFDRWYEVYLSRFGAPREPIGRRGFQGHHRA